MVIYEPFISVIYSPRFAWGGRPHRRLFWPTQTYIQKIRQNHCFFQCFYNVFRRKHRNLRGFGHKVGPKQWFLQCFQGSGIKKVQCRDLPKPLKTPLFTLFSSIFPCANAAGQLKHIYKKSFKNIVFVQCFYIFFRQTRRNLHVFWLKVGPKHWFLQCFQCSGNQKQFKASLFTVFFHFEADQNDPKFRFNTLLSSDTQKSSKKHANTTNTRSRCEISFGPPPAKADIATAILTNVIKISTPSPPKRCGRIYLNPSHGQLQTDMNAIQPLAVPWIPGRIWQWWARHASARAHLIVSFGGFRTWGYPIIDGLQGKIHLEMDDDWGYPYFRKPRCGLVGHPNNLSFFLMGFFDCFSRSAPKHWQWNPGDPTFEHVLVNPQAVAQSNHFCGSIFSPSNWW